MNQKRPVDGRITPLDGELIFLKTSEYKKFLQVQIEARCPVFAWSDPGVGKTEINRTVIAEYFSDHKYFETRFCGRDIADLYGLPNVTAEGLSGYRRPLLLPPLDAGKCAWFLDEVNRNTVQMLNVALQPVRDRMMGEHQLPPGMVVMAAGNFEDDPGVVRTSSAFNLRFKHVGVVPELDDWCLWAGPAGIEPIVIAYVRLHPEHLHLFDPKRKASPNPRTWAMFSDGLRVGLLSKASKRLIEADAVGTVGKPVGQQFMTFFEVFMADIRPDEILKHPATAPIPGNPSLLYAVAGALAYHAGEPRKFAAIRTYADRLPQEFDTLLMHMAVTKHGTKVTSTPQYTAWAAKRPEVFTNSACDWSAAA